MMLKRTLILLTFIFAQAGCLLHDEEPSGYNPKVHTVESVRSWEELKRDLLQLEDITVGDGPIAAAGRKVTAEITVRYNDGTLVYQGPAVTYWGMVEAGFIENDPRDPNLLSLQQQGIALGLNGMAVGGKRRIIVSPNLVCFGGGVGESLDKGTSPGSTCGLVDGEKELVKVRKLPLTVDATLTASCRPVFQRIGPFYIGQRCRDAELPQRAPGDPIWRFYHAAPKEP